MPVAAGGEAVPEASTPHAATTTPTATNPVGENDPRWFVTTSLHNARRSAMPCSWATLAETTSNIVHAVAPKDSTTNAVINRAAVSGRRRRGERAAPTTRSRRQREGPPPRRDASRSGLSPALGFVDQRPQRSGLRSRQAPDEGDQGGLRIRRRRQRLVHSPCSQFGFGDDGARRRTPGRGPRFVRPDPSPRGESRSSSRWCRRDRRPARRALRPALPDDRAPTAATTPPARVPRSGGVGSPRALPCSRTRRCEPRDGVDSIAMRCDEGLLRLDLSAARPTGRSTSTRLRHLRRRRGI